MPETRSGWAFSIPPYLPHLTAHVGARTRTRARARSRVRIHNSSMEGMEVWKKAAAQGFPVSIPHPYLGEVWKVRAKMPQCAAFVDDLREAFGAEEINNVIKRGLRTECPPELRVHFVEAGHELGRPAGVLGVEVVPVLPVGDAKPARGRR